MICSFHLRDNFWQERATDTIIVNWRNSIHIFFRTLVAVFAWLLTSRKTVRLWLTAFQRVEVLSLGKLFLDLWFPAGLHFLIFSQVKSHWPVLSVVPACALVREDSDIIRSKHNVQLFSDSLGWLLPTAEPWSWGSSTGRAPWEGTCSRLWRGAAGERLLAKKQVVEGLRVTSQSEAAGGKRPWSCLVLSQSHACNYTGRMGVLDPLCSVDRPESRDKAQGPGCSWAIYILFQDFFWWIHQEGIGFYRTHWVLLFKSLPVI